MAAQRGFCPFCAHVNPPDFKFCVACQRKLPPEVLGEVARGRPSSEELNALAGGRTPEPPEPLPPRSARWVILAFTVGVAAVVLVASVTLLTHVFAAGPAGSPGAGVHGRSTDLCNDQLGVNCNGNGVTLPETVNGVVENVSGCDAIYPSGSTSRLVVHYTSTARVLGALIPQSDYQGPNVSFSQNPAGFYNDSAAEARAAWESGPHLGGLLVNVSLPPGPLEWCLSWWYAGGSSASVTFTADVVLWSPST